MGGLLSDQAIDFGFGTDVDAACRFVQKQDVGLLMEQPCQGHFLLIATREIDGRLARSRRLDSERRHPMDDLGAGFLSRSQPHRECRLSAE